MMLGDEGSRFLLMGNEAVARGAIEAGVEVVAGYPGTPSSEVIESLISIAQEAGIRVEWSVNEKVAFDVCAGASLAGARSLATMKMSGLNVASDSIVSMAYSGVNGGLVVYVADDPGAHAGMVEQDSRLFARAALLPMIDAWDPRSSRDAVLEAFKVSEEFGIPVFVRSTSSVAHMRGVVGLGPFRKRKRATKLIRDIRRLTRASPVWCKEQHARLNERMAEVAARFETSQLNRLEMPEGARWGTISTGVSRSYLAEAVERYGVEGLATLSVGTTNPLPEGLIRALVDRVEKILVLEELEPHIEQSVRALRGDAGRSIKVLGKMDDSLPRVGEYTPDIVEAALGALINISLSGRDDLDGPRGEARAMAPRRPLPFCPGCSHRGTYVALRQALRETGHGEDGAIVVGDIGCTILGIHPPFNTCWMELSMGASIGLASGIKYAGEERPVIAAIGDSTFFHAGVPPTINAAWNGADIVIAVLDNEITAMTGHQPSPSSGYNATGKASQEVRIEGLLEASGVESVRVVDPYNISASRAAFVEALRAGGIAAVVLRRTCSLVARRMGLQKGAFHVSPESCTGCLLCVRTLGCPAMGVSGEGKAVIDEAACAGCGMCAQICPVGAISGGG
jgi:indolepyruvate ferredoxin oxidoreductase alpha subunit